MSELKLERFSVSATETEGVLTFGGLIFATIERPWLNNIKGVSCVPLGVYQIRLFNHAKWGDVLWLESRENNVYWKPTSPTHRSEILVHPANYVSDLRGCIAIGERRGFSTNPKTRRMEPLVVNSRESLRILVHAMSEKPTPHTLRITQRLLP